VINLFPVYDGNIDCSKFKNLIYDDVVPEFEEAFCKYTNAKYVALISNATTAITLALQQKYVYKKSISVPTILPYVVANAIINSDNFLNFVEDTEWVGWSYQLYPGIIDSAHRLDRNQFDEVKHSSDIIIYSFYPTKICGALCGAAVVSNDKGRIDWFRQKAMSGLDFSHGRQLMIGYNNYMIVPQVYAAFQQLKTLDERKEKIAEVRTIYNDALNYQNKSDHLYRIQVDNNEKFVKYMKENGITCGIHYPCLHKNKIYHPSFKNQIQLYQFQKSERESSKTVSLPLHHKLSSEDIKKIIKLVKDYE